MLCWVIGFSLFMLMLMSYISLADYERNHPWFAHVWSKVNNCAIIAQQLFTPHDLRSASKDTIMCGRWSFRESWKLVTTSTMFPSWRRRHTEIYFLYFHFCIFVFNFSFLKSCDNFHNVSLKFQPFVFYFHFRFLENMW